MVGDEVAGDKNIVFEMSPHLLAEILRERIATVLFLINIKKKKKSLLPNNFPFSRTY